MSRSRAVILSDPTLYVRRSNERLVVQREGEVVATVPIADVSHVLVVGPVTMTGAAVAGVLDAGIEITLVSSGGKLRGQVTSARPKNVFLLLAQVDVWKRPERRMAFAVPLVVGKIAAQREMVHRHARDHDSPACAHAVERLTVLERQVASQTDVDAVRGMEGAASAAYFEAFGEMLRGAWTFPGRVRRPPTDPVNALLSFGYVLATSEVARQLIVAGFDLRIGVMHGLRYGRESLPLDLVEELRTPLVDRFVLRLLNRGQLVATDFETMPDGAVRLGREARRKFLTLWDLTLRGALPRLRNAASVDELETAMRFEREAEAKAEPEERLPWRDWIAARVRALKRFMMHGGVWEPAQATRKPEPTTEGGSQRGPLPPEVPAELLDIDLD